MKKIIFTLSLVFGSNAFASSVTTCELSGTVTAVEKAYMLNQKINKMQSNLKINISLATATTGSYDDCQGFLNKDISVISDRGNFAEGDEVKLEYFYANSVSPDGIIETESLVLLD